MSRSEYPFPVKERGPRKGRYDLPKYVLDSHGDYVMEMLRTEELPEPPPADTTGARIRLTLSLIMAVLLCAVTGLGVAAIIGNSGTLFERTTRDADDAEAAENRFPGGIPFTIANDSGLAKSDETAANDKTSDTSPALTGTEHVTSL
ncbi:uncharacterized protein LOC142588733 [Dermacentor variabilis]|uniref:uncharacterized protein LOC142588733 n=1 Tax=Dermacentor variabilis TaxID=34621 RepID=UPI003F5B1256